MNSVLSIADFYAEAAPMSSGGSHQRRLKSLPATIDTLAAHLQNLIVYDVVAKDFYGFDIPGARGDEIHLRSTQEIIDRIIELNDAPLTRPRPVDRRVIGRCHHFSLLTVAALRAHGIPARARCGFGAYFNPPRFEDHWLCEYWNASENRWVLADTQLDQIWQKKLGIRFDTADVPRTQFLVAADAWRKCRSGLLDSQHFGIEFAKLRGLWFVAGSLIRDAAALNRVEMLPWDSWGAQPAPNAKLSEQELKFFDHLAAVTAIPDQTFDELLDCYNDEHVCVPAAVFNSLTQTQERIRVPHHSPAPSFARRASHASRAH